MSRLSRLVAQKLNRASDAVEAHLKDVTGPDWKDYNEAVIGDWQRKPRFEVDVTRDQRAIELTVKPTGQHKMLWVWVDQGTGLHGPEGKAYKIPKVADGRLLAFKTDYRPKTMPVANFNVGPGKALGATVFTRKQITHPGIKPRNFTLDQADEVRLTIVSELTKAIAAKLRR
ncbi:hypothetical protein HC928_03780 [bacterium]|nr:hypothetical protein [bacterium]